MVNMQDAMCAFLRRQGQSAEDSQDLVQGFFLHVLQGGILRTAVPERGRFRSFLLGTLKHYLGDERDKAQARKRGGGQQFVSWDLAQAEGRFQQELAEHDSPDQLFERRWALALLEQALERLRAEGGADANGSAFDELKGFVTGERGPMSYAEAAARLGLSLSAVKSAIFRLRRRYHAIRLDAGTARGVAARPGHYLITLGRFQAEPLEGKVSIARRR